MSSHPASEVAPRRQELHPAAWLAWAVCAGIVAMSTTNPFYLLPLVGTAWLTYAVCARLDTQVRAFRVFVTIGIAAMVVRVALVALGPLTGNSVAGAALEGLRLAVLLIIFGAFNSVTDPFSVLKLAPRRLHEASLAAALAISIAPRTMIAAERVREAQQLRGISTGRLRSLPALAIPVLERGLEDAVMLAESMDSRGHGRGPRSRYRPERLNRMSVGTLALAAGAAFVFVVAVRTGLGDLAPSVVPLDWPGVEAALVATTLAFAVPALMMSVRR
jgi:energy-coupling factor transport system permease protein